MPKNKNQKVNFFTPLGDLHLKFEALENEKTRVTAWFEPIPLKAGIHFSMFDENDELVMPPVISRTVEEGGLDDMIMLKPVKIETGTNFSIEVSYKNEDEDVNLTWREDFRV